MAVFSGWQCFPDGKVRLREAGNEQIHGRVALWCDQDQRFVRGLFWKR